MTDIMHIQQDAPIQGFRWESGTGGEGLAVIRGTAADQAKTAGASATAILGVIDFEHRDAPSAGDVVPIRRAFPGSIAYMQASAAIAVDAELSVTSAGKAVTAGLSTVVLAKAMAAAAADGDLIPVVFMDGNKTTASS